MKPTRTAARMQDLSRDQVFPLSIQSCSPTLRPSLYTAATAPSCCPPQLSGSPLWLLLRCSSPAPHISTHLHTSPHISTHSQSCGTMALGALVPICSLSSPGYIKMQMASAPSLLPLKHETYLPPSFGTTCLNQRSEKN